jgi:hypothetical protein
MSPTETAIIIALWIVLAALALLVLVLYRQLEKAYLRQQRPVDAGLAAGTEAPEIAVVSGRSAGPLELPADGSMSLLVFVTTACPACAKLMPLLTDGAIGVPAIVLISGEGFHEYADLETPTFRAHWLVNLADADHLYGVSVVPTIYVLRGQTILARTIDGTRDGILAALAEARARENGDGKLVGAEREAVASERR